MSATSICYGAGPRLPQAARIWSSSIRGGRPLKASAPSPIAKDQADDRPRDDVARDIANPLEWVVHAEWEQGKHREQKGEREALKKDAPNQEGTESRAIRSSFDLCHRIG